MSWFACASAQALVARAPAEDALGQIVAEGNLGYLNWPAALDQRFPAALLSRRPRRVIDGAVSQ